MKRGLCLLLTAILVLSGVICTCSAAEYGRMHEESEYDSLADSILQVILTDGMTDYEKCSAVYDYVHYIPYVNVVYSEDWKENGYMMLQQRSGDCFGFYAASRLLLERLGYQVIEVQNCNGFRHVWCLVSTDGGNTWLHFDPTCWRWGSDGYLCLLTDAELEAYAREHEPSINVMTHEWDRQKVAADIRTVKESRKHAVYILFPPGEETFAREQPRRFFLNDQDTAVQTENH